MRASHGALVLLAIVVFLHESWHPHAQLDDAYISYRYARNLVEGAGLVYNPGEHVEGFSNLLWTLLVAVGLALGWAADLVGHALGLASGAAALAATWLLARGFQAVPGWPAVFAPWVVLASVPFTVWATSGMETPLFTAAVTAAFAAEQRGWLRSATALAIVATLTRPEGVLVALCVFGSRLVGQRRWKSGALAYGGALLALSAFRLWYYGALLPNTFHAKVGGIPFSRGIDYLWQFMAAGGLALLPPAVVAVRGAPETWPAAAYVALTAVYVSAIGGDPFPHARFLVPAVPLLAAVGARGVGLTLGTPSSRRALVVAAFLAAPVWFVVGVPGMATFGFGDPWHPLRTNRRGVAVREFVQANAFVQGLTERTATLLRQQTPPIRLLAAGGIGVIGYYSRLPLIDYFGLVDPTVATSAAEATEGALLLPGHQRSNADYVFSRRPDFIVIGRAPREGAVYPPAALAIWRHPDLARFYEWQQGPPEGYRRRADAP